jgi:hypothetical protein
LANIYSISKNNLLHTFCFSFYSSDTWNLQHPENLRVCAAWRAALQRIWHLPTNAHRDTVSALVSINSLLDELCNRLVTFIVYCLNSHNCNSPVNFVEQKFSKSASSSGTQILFICNRYNFCHELNFDMNNPSLFLSNYCRE